MAKVEIEDRAFSAPKVRTAVAHKRVPTALVLGHAAILWRASQQDGVEVTTREQIEAWLDMDRFSKPKRAFDLLVAAGFIEPMQNGEWKIDGNSLRIARVATRVKNAKEAIRARYVKEGKYDSYTDRTTPRIPDIKTGRQVDRKTDSKTPNPFSAAARKRAPAGFKNEAMALIGTILGLPPAAWNDDNRIRDSLGPKRWALFLRRFPQGPEQFVAFWQRSSSNGTPQGVVTSQLRDIFAAFLADDAAGTCPQIEADVR